MSPHPVRTCNRAVNDRAVAFETLFEQHWSAVHAYARRRVRTADDAHDVAAETFTVAWRRLEDVPEDHALPWLYRTASNVLHNGGRSDRRRSRLTNRLASLPVPASADPADIATDDHVLVDAFSTLSPEDRDVLRLVAWEGLTNTAVGRVLGVSTNAAALRVSRARQRLGRAIEAAETGGRMTEPRATGHETDDREEADEASEGRTR